MEKYRTIILDLDETLVHTLRVPNESLNAVSQRIYNICPDTLSQNTYFDVIVRPGAEEFVRTISEKYNIVIYSAGVHDYVFSIIRTIFDPFYIYVKDENIFSRKHCILNDINKPGYFIKSISNICQDIDINDVIMLDDQPDKIIEQECVIRIVPYNGQNNCEELHKISNILCKIHEKNYDTYFIYPRYQFIKEYNDMCAYINIC